MRLEIGEEVEVLLYRLPDYSYRYCRVVKVTVLHSGYYDDMYTGIAKDTGEKCYFSYCNSEWKGRFE